MYVCKILLLDALLTREKPWKQRRQTDENSYVGIKKEVNKLSVFMSL